MLKNSEKIFLKLGYAGRFAVTLVKKFAYLYTYPYTGYADFCVSVSRVSAFFETLTLSTKYPYNAIGVGSIFLPDERAACVIFSRISAFSSAGNKFGMSPALRRDEISSRNASSFICWSPNINVVTLPSHPVLSNNFFISSRQSDML